MFIIIFMIYVPIYSFSYINNYRVTIFNHINSINKINDTSLQIIDEKLPVYPYLDAPINLFFGQKSSDSTNSNVYVQLDVIERLGRGMSGKYDDGLSYVIDWKNEENKSYEYSPPCNEEGGIREGDYYRKFEGLILDSSDENDDEIRMDLSEYDVICPGLGKWPEYKDIIDSGVMINTSLYHKFKSVKGLTSKPPVQPYRKEVKSIGEAIIEQKKWFERSKIPYKDWNLDYEEMSGLPDHVRDSYYRRRFDIIKGDPSLVFDLALRMRRASGDVSEYHPMEFRYIEDSYTYRKSKSPIVNDLYKWKDPLNSSWRLRVEEMIRDAVSYDWPPSDLRVHSGLVVYDITWVPGIIKVFIKRAGEDDYVSPRVLGELNNKELDLLYSKINMMLKLADFEEELGIYDNHRLEIHNTLSEYPESRRDWNERMGLLVNVYIKGDGNRSIKGRLAGSNSVFGLKLNLDGKVITIPTHYIKCIRMDKE